MVVRRGFPDEQKWAVALQVEDGKLSVREAASSVGVSMTTVYRWIEQYRERQAADESRGGASLLAENRRLKAELRRVTEERDILKKAAVLFARSAHPADVHP